MSKHVSATAAAVALLGTLVGCGGSEPSTMPDVTSQRLDVALSDIERAGFEDEVEVLGGGVFGVVDESNWTVCEQDPPAGDEVSSAPRLTVDRSCGKEEQEDPQADDNRDERAKERRNATSGSGNKSGNKPRPADETFVMPPLVGGSLQDAQDMLQSLGSYVLTQTDASGMERFQVDDDNWKVCYQVPAPGVETKLSELVELGAVQLDEPCP